MARRAPPIESFGPKLFAVWERATRERVILEPASKSEAVRLRHKLYSLRKALAEAGHDLYTSAARATIRLSEKEPGKFILIIEPADTDFDATLDQANITTPPAPTIDFGELKENEV